MDETFHSGAFRYSTVQYSSRCCSMKYEVYIQEVAGNHGCVPNIALRAENKGASLGRDVPT
jgi:hypothetical protein